MKIYSLYRMLSLDIIFYYAIEFLFLTQVKNISAADVVLKSSFYALFMIILQIPATIVVERLGTRRCTILGNIFKEPIMSKQTPMTKAASQRIQSGTAKNGGNTSKCIRRNNSDSQPIYIRTHS